MVAEDRGLELEVVRSICAMAMLVRIVRLVLLGLFAEEVHLKVHVSASVSANRRVRLGVLGREPVNVFHRHESILNGSVEE